jgi:hypothetical protein
MRMKNRRANFYCYTIVLFWLFLTSGEVIGKQAQYPWELTGFAGVASLCDELGCFGQTGFAFGGSFGRQFTERWDFELEGTYVSATESLAPRFDLRTNQIFVPQLQRQRVWAGGSFLRQFLRFGEASHLFLSIGFVTAYERQTEKVPEGFLHAPKRDIGLKGGVSAGAGAIFWFSDNWALRPEMKFYAVPSPLSGLRYTGGIAHRF